MLSYSRSRVVEVEEEEFQVDGDGFAACYVVAVAGSLSAVTVLGFCRCQGESGEAAESFEEPEFC